MPELEIGLLDGGEWNFNQSFLKLNVKKNIQAKSHSRSDFKYWIARQYARHCLSA